MEENWIEKLPELHFQKHNDDSPDFEEVESLIKLSCEIMYNVYNNPKDSQLYLPVEYSKGNGKTQKKYEDKDNCRFIYPNNRRLSEQEFKQAFISCLSKTKEFKYSVETPTTNFYKFSGEDISELNQCIKFTDPQPTNAGETLPNTIPDTDKNGDDVINKSADLHNNSKFISARIDLTLYKSDASICHHIEFKAHNPAYKDIAKDILKLFWEPTPNKDTHYTHYFLHIVESFDKYTRLSLIGKYIKALNLKGEFSNKIYIHVYNVREDKLYRFHTDQLLLIPRESTTNEHSHDGYNILYKISRYRYRNSKCTQVSDDKDLQEFCKNKDNINNVIEKTEKYWESAHDKE